ncbi:MAG: NAD(P)-dependent oxidoreductase, partial [Paenibacillus macerans]
MPHYMPVMLNLEGRRCVIVGGGTVAARKAAALTEAGAVVTVISPGVTAWLQDRVREGEIAWLAREYREGDLKGAFLVFAATDSRQVNDSIVKEAEMLGIPVNDTAD